MFNKPAILLAGAAFSIGVPAGAQTQCGGHGGLACYLKSSSINYYPDLGGCYQRSYGLASCAASVTAMCVNKANPTKTYNISSSNGLGLGCYLFWAAAKAVPYGGIVALSSKASVWSSYNFPGYWRTNYTDCSNTQWYSNGGTFNCYGQ